MQKAISIFVFLFIAGTIAAQDTLPKFSVQNAGKNRIIVGWVNNYPFVKQIGIQRSFDSLANFKTILTVTDPNAKQNGFADNKAVNDHMFYRLFIVLDKGEYFYTASLRPVTQTTVATTITDSGKVVTKTDSVKVTPVIPKKPDFVPSFYVYTNKDGYVFVNLPDADKKKYRIKFFEDDEDFLFEIKTIKDPALILDKTNFLHAGWFRFELYNDEKLIEKNKFYLAKEF